SRPNEDSFSNTLKDIEILNFDTAKITEFIEAWANKNSIEINPEVLIKNLKKSKLFAPSYDLEINSHAIANMALDALSSKVPMYTEKMYRIDSFKENLFASPLLLSFICELYIKESIDFNTYSQIFDTTIAFIFSKWNLSRAEKSVYVKSEQAVSKYELINYCNYLAYYLLEDFNVSIEEKELYNLTKDYFKTKGIAVSNYENIYKSLHLDYGILKRSSHGFYSFFHLSFAEYFCAKHMTTITFDEVLPIRRYFLYGQKEIGKYYYELLDLDGQIAYLQRGFKAAFYHMMTDRNIASTMSKVQKLVDSHSDSSLTKSEADQERLLLFFFFFYIENLKEYAVMLSEIFGLVLQRLILNLKNKDLLFNANYLYLSKFQSLYIFAENMGSEKAMDIADIIKDEYQVEGETQITFKDRQTKLGYKGAIKLTSALYIIERLLWLNEQNNNVLFSDILELSHIDTEQYLPNAYAVNMFSAPELYIYATETKFREESPEVIEEIYYLAIPKVNDAFYYYYLIATHSIYNLENPSLAKYAVDTAIDDFKARPEFWHEEFKNDDLTVDDYIKNLYELRGYINFRLSIMDPVQETFDLDLIKAAVSDYERKPLDAIKPSHLSYYAFVSMHLGEEINDNSYLEKSLKLYKAAIEHEEDYIIGYLNAIKIAHLLEEKEQMKSLIRALRPVIKPKHFNNIQNLKDTLEIYDQFMEKEEDQS
ncbi:MAG: hypothetical protein AAFX55_05055, partial [Bacteroidota bacterium]